VDFSETVSIGNTGREEEKEGNVAEQLRWFRAALLEQPPPQRDRYTYTSQSNVNNDQRLSNPPITASTTYGNQKGMVLSGRLTLKISVMQHSSQHFL